MATISKIHLSGSLNGSGISLDDSQIITIHNSSVYSNIIDEVWIYATNSYSSEMSMYLNIGGSSEIYTTISSQSGLALIVPGLIISGNDTVAKSITGVCGHAAAEYLKIFGYVNRITL